MAHDVVESICVIPSDGFDEMWMSVNRANGRMIERMVLRDEYVDCGDIHTLTSNHQVFLDSCVNYSEQQKITSILVSGGTEYTITLPNHGYSNGDIVSLTHVLGAPQLNHTKWIIGVVTTNTFKLISEVL